MMSKYLRIKVCEKWTKVQNNCAEFENMEVLIQAAMKPKYTEKPQMAFISYSEFHLSNQTIGINFHFWFQLRCYKRCGGIRFVLKKSLKAGRLELSCFDQVWNQLAE